MYLTLFLMNIDKIQNLLMLIKAKLLRYSTFKSCFELFESSSPLASFQFSTAVKWNFKSIRKASSPTSFECSAVDSICHNCIPNLIMRVIHIIFVL